MAHYRGRSDRLMRILSLEMLAELKRQSPHPKDKQVLSILEALLRKPE